MNQELLDEYNEIRGGRGGFYEQARGLIRVSGKEAVPFLNGMLTNDVAKLEDEAQMRAAFPNAQGRLLATARVLKKDAAFLFETEAATREKIYTNLFRFTFAGDFFVEDLSDEHRFFTVQSEHFKPDDSRALVYETNFGADYFVPNEAAAQFTNSLETAGARRISDEIYEILRIENGVLLYGADADETTIVPELGIADLISYNKGCYVGQEIIARIYFRGHVAKQLTGLILDAPAEPNAELKSLDGKNAGRITSTAFSPALGKTIALAYVRYDYLAEGTELKIGDRAATVKSLPFVGRMR